MNLASREALIRTPRNAKILTTVHGSKDLITHLCFLHDPSFWKSSSNVIF
jgi:hypothetical protein